MENFSAPAASKKTWNKKAVRVLIGILFVIVVIGGAHWLIRNYSKNTYQAVFLTNGQTYFGKLAEGQEHYILSDVFYLQNTPAPQSKQGNQGSKIQLIKLGEELHGPEDKMQITKSSVLFWETMRRESKIVKAIQAYKEQESETK